MLKFKINKLFTNNALIIVEVNEPNKAPDLKYISFGSSDINKTDEEFTAIAIKVFKEEKNYPVETTFIQKGVLKFGTEQEYFKFLNSQFSDYLDSL